ncbi:MAG: gas vesicle protein GvpJ [Gemmatimonadaceae bacterium]
MSNRDLDDSSLVLSDLLNRVLDIGVVISGHVTISIADIDLLELDLKLLLTSIETATQKQFRLANPPKAADANASVLPPARGK